MNGTTGYYYDGKSSQRHAVELSFEAPAHLRVKSESLDFVFPFRQLDVSPRVGNTRRSIRLPDGAMCVTEDNDTVDAWLATQGEHAVARLVHRWESGFRYALLALAIAVVAVWAGLQWGIPALAKQVAYRLSPEIEEKLGEQTLQALDKFLLEPSKLSASRQQQLNAMFAEMKRRARGGEDLRLVLRYSERAGANAFALPSGVIVMTDALVELAQHDNEIVAVLAHEMGHVEQRHTLRHVLQNSATAVLLAGLLGDVTSVTALGAALPTLMLEAKYSREFENEADSYALRYLKEQRIPTRHFSDILLRLGAQRDGEGSAGLLSTHPDSRERAKRFQGNGED